MEPQPCTIIVAIVITLFTTSPIEYLVLFLGMKRRAINVNIWYAVYSYNYNLIRITWRNS